MSNQLIKETAQGREQVFPKNYIQNLKDKDSGANLEDILKSFNMLFLPYLGNKPDTRKQVPMSLRHGGLWVTYIVNNTVVTEWYDSTAVDDYTWGSDAYWREGSNMLVGDISISKQGTWVINGEDTGISSKGDKGDSGKSSYQLAVNEGYKGTLEEFLNLIKEIYIGVGSTYSDIFINDNKYENIKSPSTFNITANNNKIIVIYPNTNLYISTPKLNGIDIPFVNSTFIDNNIQYNVFTSINNYNGNFNITI